MKCRLRGWYINERELTEHLVGRRKKTKRMQAESLTEDDEAWGRLLVCVFDNKATWHQEGGGQMLTYKRQRGGHVQVKHIR